MAALANYFRTRRNQYQKQTIQRLYRANPMKSLVPSREYRGEDGENPTIITHTHELPASYPFNVASHNSGLGTLGMETIKRTLHDGTAYTGEDDADLDEPNALLAGTNSKFGGTGEPPYPTSPEGVAAGNSPNDTGYPSAHEIRRGQLERTFEIRGITFDTAEIALDDIKRAHQAAETANAWGKALTEFTTVFFSDWYRVQNIGMISNKYVPVTSTSGVSIEDDYNQDFSGITANTDAGALEWWHLEEMYWDLVARGAADELSIGMANGHPVFPLYLGPKIKNYLWRDETNVAETFKWHDPKSRIAQLGYPKAIKGFFPIVDVFPIRYSQATTIEASTPVYPTENVTTSFGYKHKPAAAYKTAEVEIATIIPPNVYECVFEASSPTAFAGMDFDPQDYSGEFNFINNKTFKGHNDRGNRGYFLADIRVGAKPLNPDLGYSIAHNISGL